MRPGLPPVENLQLPLRKRGLGGAIGTVRRIQHNTFGRRIGERRLVQYHIYPKQQRAGSQTDYYRTSDVTGVEPFPIGRIFFTFQDVPRVILEPVLSLSTTRAAG